MRHSFLGTFEIALPPHLLFPPPTQAKGGAVIAADIADIRCSESPVVASASGPTLARADLGFKLEASLLDPDKAQDPVAYAWVCASSLGACFSGSSRAEAAGNSYAVQGGALEPALYTFTVGWVISAA